MNHVKHNTWTEIEYKGITYRARFVKYGCSYASMEVEVLEKVKKFLKRRFVNRWVTLISSSRDLCIGSPIDQQQFYPLYVFENTFLACVESRSHTEKIIIN